MPREITDRERVVQSVKTLAPTSELFDEQNGRQKYESDLEVIVQGRDYGNGKRVGPYVRLLEYDASEQIMRQGEWGGNTFYIAVEGTLDVEVSDESGGQTKIGELLPGTCFGEMALLAGIERNATISVPAGNKAVVLEVDRPALRLLRKLPKFGQILDETYRAHGLGRVFEDLHLGRGPGVSDELLNELKRVARYVVYGKHHVLCQEGTPIDRIVFIKSGWARRSHGIPIHPTSTEVVMLLSESIAVDFLGAGKCLGLEGVKEPERWKYSASVMARTEALEIPLTTFSNDSKVRAELATLFSRICGEEEFVPKAIDNADIQSLKSAEQEIATGVIDGANLLVMDMDLCVRCGNCSLACHKVHGQSRLLRRGIQIERPVGIGKRRLQHALVPQVCMHCKDPECLTGCPTGAIFRDPLGQVDIHAADCIGCFDCATQCPYDAITMVPRNIPARSFSAVNAIKNLLRRKPAPVEAFSDGDDVVAIKCNLCQNTGLNPAGASRQAYSCEENCPTGALVRVNPIEYFDEIGAIQGLVIKDQTHAIGRNIHKSDPLSRAWHIIGGSLVVAAVVATIFGLRRLGFDEPVAVSWGSWLTMRWLTGLSGLAGILVVMTYPMRKQIYRRRAGALRYWLLLHSYIGVAAGVVLLLHSGKQTGGLLTTALYLTFDVVILSGLLGVAVYLVAPRIMTRIEGEPLLVEDLEARRNELQEERAEIVKKSEGWVREEIEERIYPRFMGRGFLWQQIFKRQDLKAQLAQAREEFKERTARIATDDERELLISAVETTVTLRRVDALLLLHKSLRVWIPPHVISTALMLALMTVHIIQVVFFRMR